MRMRMAAEPDVRPPSCSPPPAIATSTTGQLVEGRYAPGACVEVARNLPSIVAVRDSKNPHGPVLTLGSAGWREFIADVKAGRHDLA